MTTAIAPRLAQHVQGVGLILLSSLGYGLMPILAKICYAAGASIPGLLTVRFTIAGLVLFAYILICGRGTGLDNGTTLKTIFLAGLGFSSTSALFFGALAHVPASVAEMCLYSYPAFVVALVRLLLGQRPGLLRILAASLVVVGTGVMLWSPGLNLSWQGVAMGLGSALVYAFYVVGSGQLASRAPAELLSAVSASTCAIVFATAGGLTRSLNFGSWTSPAWVGSIGIALLSTVLALVAFFAGVKRIGAAEAAIVGASEPALTVILALLILGERVTLIQGAGMALVLVGVVSIEVDHLVGRRRDLG